MARLHEYQGKAILAENGFKIPRGRAASTADEAVAVAKELLARRAAKSSSRSKPGLPGAPASAESLSPKSQMMFAATPHACWR